MKELKNQKEKLEHLKEHIMSQIKDLNDPKSERQKVDLVFLSKSLLIVEDQLKRTKGE